MIKIFNLKGFFFSLLIIAFISPIFSDNHNELLIKKVRQSLDSIKPFTITFVQKVFSDNQLDIEETGEILFKDDSHLKWTYLQPDLKIFLIEKDQYKFYDEENEQLTIGKIKEKNKQWIWQLFFSEEISQFATADEKARSLFLKKDDSDPPLDIEIVLNKEYLPIKVIENNPSGIQMIFYFNNYKKRVKVPSGAFDLKIPEGVDIVYETEE